MHLRPTATIPDAGQSTPETQQADTSGCASLRFEGDAGFFLLLFGEKKNRTSVPNSTKAGRKWGKDQRSSRDQAQLEPMAKCKCLYREQGPETGYWVLEVDTPKGSIDVVTVSLHWLR